MGEEELWAKEKRKNGKMEKWFNKEKRKKGKRKKEKRKKRN